MRNITKVGMLFAQEVFEEGIDMHSPHPPFQSDGILLYLLYRLTFGDIRWLDSEVLGELTPSLDIFSIELDDKLPQSICLKLFVVTPRRSIKLSTKSTRIDVEVEMWVAVQDEGYICICNIVGVDVLGGQ
jgi:hypothetical protein